MSVTITSQPPISETEMPPRIARMGDRTLSTILDMILMSGPAFMVIVVTAALYHVPAVDGQITLHGGPAFLCMFLCTIVWSIYYFVAESIFEGSTLGKEMMGIAVHTFSGKKCTSQQIFTRTLCRYIDGIGFYLLGFLVAISSDKNLRIGDRLARTVVIENPTAKRLKAGIAWVVVLVVMMAFNLYLMVVYQTGHLNPFS